MNCYLSRTSINSFQGDVVCLKLISDQDIAQADIQWQVEPAILRIREFSGSDEFSFNDGILLSLDQVGSATVWATLDGTRYECQVTIREPKQAGPDDKLNFYQGDFHDHTTHDHSMNSFPRRTEGFPIDIINSVVKDGRLQFVVLSDHGTLMKPTDLFRVFYDADRADCEGLIVFPGSESECVACHTDEFGLPQREAGEFVLVNSADYIFAENFSQVNDILARNPYAIASIAHPSTWTTLFGDGCMITPRLYNAASIPEWKRAVRLFEMGNGSDRGSTMLFELSYSLALDLGYRVSPVCPSDCHGLPHEPAWGFDAWPGKVIIMAPEKSKEHFIDAFLHNRVYGSENGNTALSYTVNEGRCGDTLSPATQYHFHVTIDAIDPTIPVTPVRCEVLSDYGQRLLTIENTDFSSFDFTVENDTARYFYLRVIDQDGLKTWSAPVWTGRAFDPEPNNSDLNLLDSSKFCLTNSDGEDASILISRNPSQFWSSPKTSDTITVDMKETQELSAIRLHAATHNLKDIRKMQVSGTELIAEYPAEYRLSVSMDGEHYDTINEGLFRIFGLGYTIHFNKVCARYVKLELLTTIGKYSCRPVHADAKVALGEIEFFHS